MIRTLTKLHDWILITFPIYEPEAAGIPSHRHPRHQIHRPIAIKRPPEIQRIRFGSR